MKNQLKKHDITQCALYKCRSKSRLAKILQIDSEEFNDLDKIVNYSSFLKDKKDGEQRKITSPNKKLKTVQRRILRLLTRIERPPWVISSQRGKSYIDNGKYHQQSTYLISMDIRKFYENCSREYIYQFFKNSLHTSSDVAEILTTIVTLENKLPTGSPTSQIIAYYAYQKMFNEIHDIAEQYGCIFTLYVDDMTFSSNLPFNTSQLKNKIDIELRRYSHKPKYSKIKYFSKKKHKIVTGVSITPDNKLSVTNNLRIKIYTAAVNQLRKSETFSDSTPSELKTLMGQLQAAQSVDPSIFPEIRRLVDRKTKNITI